MGFKRRKKVTRARGKHTHGWGAMKKHRGAGNRGGRGNAGSGKRGDAKKPSFWKDVKRYGKHGFHEQGTLAVHVPGINAGHLASIAGRLVRDGDASAKGGLVTVDLGALGFGRLLGGGIVSVKLDVTVGWASAKAIEKVGKAGGTVTVTGTKDDADAMAEPDA